METISPQEKTIRIDAATRALLDEARAEALRGEVFSEPDVESYLDQEYEAWLKSHKTAEAA